MRSYAHVVFLLGGGRVPVDKDLDQGHIGPTRREVECCPALRPEAARLEGQVRIQNLWVGFRDRDRDRIKERDGIRVGVRAGVRVRVMVRVQV